MYNLREIFKCIRLKFTVSGRSKQTNIHYECNAVTLVRDLLRLAPILHDRRRVVLSTEEQERREATGSIYTSTDVRHTYSRIVRVFGALNVSMTSQIDKCQSQQSRLLHVSVVYAESENHDTVDAWSGPN